MNATPSSWRTNAAGAAILLALTAALGVVPGWLLVSNRQSVASQADALDAARLDHASAMSALTATRSQLTGVQADLATSAVQLEPPSAVNRRLADLSTLATECGLEVDELKPAEPIPGQHSRRVPVHMIARGSYRQCVMFLNRLRSQLPDTGARSVELSGTPTEPDGRVSLRCMLWWHAMPAETTELDQSAPDSAETQQV
ncbi:MAG: type 4a pilus biogenesis protein PilO [Planctomycetota bacterium]|jgi:Tfp pilus assembly protein PilO